MLPSEEAMAALPDGLCRAMALRNCMTRTVVSVRDPAPHAALGLPAYVQFTSPIRRYTDLLTHYQVRLRPRRRPRLSLLQPRASSKPWAPVSVQQLPCVQQLLPMLLL